MRLATTAALIVTALALSARRDDQDAKKALAVRKERKRRAALVLAERTCR